MRCFIAIDVNDEIKKRIEMIQKEFEIDGIKLVAPQNMHITLKFLGEIEDVSDIVKKLDSLKWTKFKIKFNRIGCFPNMKNIRIIWAGIDSEGLTILANKIQEILGRDKFAGHLTIGRVRKKIDNLPDKIEKLRSKEFGYQLVDKFYLKKSTLTYSGPIYENIGIFNATK